MNKHVPTTEEVRESYAGQDFDSEIWGERFDTWLEWVKREAREQALIEAAEDYEGYLVNPDLPIQDQPSAMARHYRSTADRLRRRAEIAREGKADD